MARPELLVLTWTPQWRCTRFAEALGTRAVVPAPFVSGAPWPVRYLVQGLATLVVLARARPRAVLFTNPPAIAGIPLVIAGRLLGIRVWADCHSGPWTDPRWMRFDRIHRWVMRRCDGALIHSPPLLDAHGSEAPRALLSWTPPLQDLSGHASSAIRSTGAAPQGEPYVVAVLSYQVDEPIDALFAAARLRPGVRLRCTGRAPEAVRDSAPANVEFTGFVPDADYVQLLAGAAAVVCLTTWRDAMQQGVADALEAGVPAITTDSPTMRDWAAGTGTATLVEPEDPEAIAAAFDRISASATDLAAGRQVLFDRAERDWQEFLGVALRAG